MGAGFIEEPGAKIYLLRRPRRPLVITATTARRKLTEAGVLLVGVMLATSC